MTLEEKMGTKATFTVIRDDLTVHMHTPHNGHPWGVAGLLVECDAEQRPGDMPEALIRAGLELMACPDSHKDRQHYYVIHAPAPPFIRRVPTIAHHPRYKHDGPWRDHDDTPMPLDKFIDRYWGRRCPSCGARPKIETDRAFCSYVTVQCCDFGGGGHTYDEAIARYNARCGGEEVGARK